MHRLFVAVLTVGTLLLASSAAIAIEGESKPASTAELAASASAHPEEPAPPPPWPNDLQVGIAYGALALLALGTLVAIALPAGRRILRKGVYLFRNVLAVDVGLGGLAQMLLYTIAPAVFLGVQKALSGGDEWSFDWGFFWLIVTLLFFSGLFSNLVQLSMTARSKLGPGAGGVWRDDRKTKTAGVLRRINLNLTHGKPSREEALAILQDLLDLVVLHARDYRGSYRDDPDVFANILLKDGEHLVVVARDSNLGGDTYQRNTPVRYKAAGMLCGRVIVNKRAQSIGELQDEYPDGPQNKPYRSVFALPLYSARSDGDAIGALSIDCSRPYFFQTFVPQRAENELENSLQPYTQTIMLVLETLVNRDARRALSRLAPEGADESGGEES